MDGSVVVARFCTPSNAWFLEPTRVHIPNDISIGSAIFAQLTTKHHYTLQRAAPFPPQNCPFAWIWTPSNTWFLGPTRVHNRNGTSIDSAVLRAHDCVRQTDRQTDNAPCHSICNSRPHLCSTAMQPRNKYKWRSHMG